MSIKPGTYRYTVTVSAPGHQPQTYRGTTHVADDAYESAVLLDILHRLAKAHTDDAILRATGARTRLSLTPN